MKLDSIVYDIPTLADALSEQLQLDSPTFKAMYPSETATSLVNVMAGYGSMLQYMVVSALANCYTDSAFSPSGIYQLAETLGNRLHGNIASSVTCDLIKDTCRTVASIIPANSIFTVEGKPFFNPYAISFALGTSTVKNVLLVQGTQVTVEKLTTGVADEKLYFGSNFEVDPNYIHVYVNGVEWTIVDSFISYDVNSVLNESDLQVVVVRTDSDGRCYVKFGNGTNGYLPTEGSVVQISFVTNEGEDGNILKNNLDVSLVTPIYYDQEQLKVSATSTSTAYGGSNTQSLAVLKESSPYVFASGDRCVRRNDYKAVLLNKCGYKTCNVWGEYEEAEKTGSYDKSMMNVVYYTGIKSFRHIEPYEIGSLTYNDMISDDRDIYTWTGSLATSRALPGSVQITIENTMNPDTKITFTDTGGHGVLFNNNDLQFSTDDFGTDYLNDIASLRVIQGGENGYNKIENIVTDLPNSNINSYYESTRSLTYTKPVQIAIDYLTQETSRAFAGIKFYIPNGDARYVNNSVGSFAVYGTNETNPQYSNVRNNPDWVQVIPFTDVVPARPGEWGDWIASDLFETGKGARITVRSPSSEVSAVTYFRDSIHDGEHGSYAWTTSDKKSTVYTGVAIPLEYDRATETLGSDVFDSITLSTRVGTVETYDNWPLFSRYVIEIYSVYNKSVDTLKMGKIKILYAESETQGLKSTEVSTINYDQNGAIELKIENASSIFDDLYSYTSVVKNLKAATSTAGTDGYLTGDVLYASYPTNYYVYSSINENNEVSETGGIINSGKGYLVGDIVQVSDGTNALHFQITSVSNLDPDNKGAVLDGEWLEPYGSVVLNGIFDATLYSRPANAVTVVSNPQNATIVLNAKCFIKANGIYYYRSEGLDKESATAWTTLNPSLAETVYLLDDPAVGVPVYEYNEGTGTLDPTGYNITFYQPPLAEPMGLRLGVHSGGPNGEPITYKYKITVLGSLPAYDKENDVSFYYDVDTIVENVGDLTNDFYGRFEVSGTQSLTFEPGSERPLPDEKIATLTVASDPALRVKASYYGNRVSDNEVARLDGVILEKYNHFTTFLEFVQPSIVQVKIVARVSYDNAVNLTAVKQEIVNAVNKLFEVTPTFMGAPLLLSDIYKAIRDVSGVNYVLIDHPTTNINIGPNQALVLSDFELIDEI